MRKVSLVSKFILLFLRGESTPQFFCRSFIQFLVANPSQKDAILSCLRSFVERRLERSGLEYTWDGGDRAGEHPSDVYLHKRLSALIFRKSF